MGVAVDEITWVGLKFSSTVSRMEPVSGSALLRIVRLTSCGKYHRGRCACASGASWAATSWKPPTARNAARAEMASGRILNNSVRDSSEEVQGQCTKMR